jgi:hypothetical protein
MSGPLFVAPLHAMNGASYGYQSRFSGRESRLNRTFGAVPKKRDLWLPS